MPLDPTALGYTSPTIPVSWDERDTMLYALSIGAGIDDLEYTTENTAGVRLIATPSMPVVYCQPSSDVWDRLGDFDWSCLVHAAQSLELHTPIPPAGAGSITTTITKMSDKGTAAVVTARTELRDSDGTSLATGDSTVFIRGAGGWGGDRGATATPPTPEGPADRNATVITAPTQALLYRLNADRNPLHSDPAFARKANFDRPILHGLCTLGIAILSVARINHTPGLQLRRFSARFANSCYPGDALTTRMWTTDESTVAPAVASPVTTDHRNVAFDTIGPGGDVILSQGVATFGPMA
ncbi:3-hydroxyacyl-thioester dehydratase [Rhodococcus opacus]|nr:3-hydroxyacyl-thioester dehydratase [Rhodococcus opacus]